MILKVKSINLRETDELEPYIVSNPDVIEEGFRVIANQHLTDSGHLDILGIDSEGTLVVIELKNEAAEGHLSQGLRYYDWCRQNVSWISQAYQNKFEINRESPPRLLLVAPSFTDTVKRIAKYVDIDLQLVEYHAFENENGEVGLICTEIDYGQPPEPPQIPTIEKKIEYFQDKKVKELFTSVITELEQSNIEARPIAGLWISFWYKGKRFMSMSPKRKFFVAHVLSPGGNWNGRERISNRKEWNSIFENQIQTYIEYLDSER